MKSGAHKATGREPHAPDIARMRTQLDAYMLKRGLRSTEQRRLIIDTFFESVEHITIDELLSRVKKDDHRIGYATVYRAMKMLADAGVALERKFGDGFTRYEIAHEGTHHDHLICVECGRITEFEEPRIEELQERIAERYGFEVRSHKHELYGVCAECQAKEASRRGPRS